MVQKMLFAGSLLAAILVATVIVADVRHRDYQAGYQAGLSAAYADNWCRELAWRKVLTEIGQETEPIRISVAFLDHNRPVTNIPGNIAIGVFRDSGKNRFTRYTIRDGNMRVERYAEWGRWFIGFPVTDH